MNRRAFLRSIGAAAASVRGVRLQADLQTSWRTFEIATRVHVQQPAGVTRVWLPTPLAAAPYQKTLGDTYHADGGSLTMVEREDVDMLVAVWPDGADPILTLISQVQTTMYAANLETPTVPPPKDFASFNRDLRGTRLLPLDGASKDRAAAMTRGAGTDFDKARAIFDAIADTPAGQLDARDPNVVFVGLARAAGLPARAVFGLRVANADATKAQHCRAEVYLVGYGWVPIDARDRLFGSWAMQWIGYNSAHDVALPGSSRGAVGSLMYPQGETANGRLDSLNPDAFRYQIAVREIR